MIASKARRSSSRRCGSSRWRTKRHSSRSGAIGTGARRREGHSSRRRSSLAKVGRREARHASRWRREARKTTRWRRERHSIGHRRSHSTADRRKRHAWAGSVGCRDGTWRREAERWRRKRLTGHGRRHWAACRRVRIGIRLNSLILVVGHDRVNDTLCTFTTNLCAVVNVRPVSISIAVALIWRPAPLIPVALLVRFVPTILLLLLLQQGLSHGFEDILGIDADA